MQSNKRIYSSGILLALLMIFAALTLRPEPVSANVELIFFRAVPNSNTITLEWLTGSELDTQGFYVKRSDSPNGFIDVEASNWDDDIIEVEYEDDVTDFVPSASLFNGQTRYEAIDDDVVVGQTYYYQLVELELSSTLNALESSSATVGATPEPSPTSEGGTGINLPTSTPTTEPATNTPQPTATNTPTPEPDATNTPTPTITPTPEPGATETPVPTATDTADSDPDATATPSSDPDDPDPTATPAESNQPTATPLPTTSVSSGGADGSGGSDGNDDSDDGTSPPSNDGDDGSAPATTSSDDTSADDTASEGSAPATTSGAADTTTDSDPDAADSSQPSSGSDDITVAEASNESSGGQAGVAEAGQDDDSYPAPPALESVAPANSAYGTGNETVTESDNGAASGSSDALPPASDSNEANTGLANDNSADSGALPPTIDEDGGNSSRLILWIAFGAALLIFGAGVIGAIMMFGRRRNEE